MYRTGDGETVLLKINVSFMEPKGYLNELIE